MGTSPEVLSWTSCPSLLVGKLKEELKLTVVGEAIKKTNQNSPLQPPCLLSPSPLRIPADPPPPSPQGLRPPRRDEEATSGGGTSPMGALSEDSSRENRHFDNSVLQLQEQEEAESPSSGSLGGQQGRGRGGRRGASGGARRRRRGGRSRPAARQCQAPLPQGGARQQRLPGGPAGMSEARLEHHREDLLHRVQAAAARWVCGHPLKHRQDKPQPQLGGTVL